MSALNVFVTEFLEILQAATSSRLARILLGGLALAQIFLNTGWPPEHTVKDGDVYDFIVVGSGSSGGIIAARLAEILQWRVLLLEAGSNPPVNSRIPSLFATLANTKYDWAYPAYFDDDMGNARVDRKTTMSRGKVLGGCSSTNYLVYSRGVPRDYEIWNESAPGWSWADVLPYFKKFENMTDPSVFTRPQNAALHSISGPVGISRPDDNPVYANINNIRIDAYRQIGIEPVLENNGPEPFGISRPHLTFADGLRSSVAEEYMRDIDDKPNLTVAKDTRALKILINQDTMQAYGMEVLNNKGQKVHVYANFEVILSAGTIDSAKLLLLSGIGPYAELIKHGIYPIADLPVGQEMQDHPFVPLIFVGKKGVESAISNLLVPTRLREFPVPFLSSFFRLDHVPVGPLDRPQFQTFNAYIGATASPITYYGCGAYGFVDRYCKSLANYNTFNEIDMVPLVLLHEKSRGSVTLKSNNPMDDPVVKLGYYREKEDLMMMVEGIKYIRRLENTSYYTDVKGFLAKLDVPGCEGIPWASDEYWICYIKATTGSMLHPVGSCKMTVDGVVNERLKVYKVKNLRVGDASIMPETCSGNTNAASMMIGEKLSDIIKQDYGVATQFLF